MILLFIKKNNLLFRAPCLDSISRLYKGALIAVALLLSACFTSNPPIQVPLEREMPALTLTKLGGDPLLYKVTIPSVSIPVFATALEACGVKDFVPSKATTRQLLVGFENIKVNAQTAATVEDGSLFQSDISATVDDEPISLMTFTKRNNDCVKDFAFWYRSKLATPELSQAITKALSSHFISERVAP